jgi:hypothetical protein
VVPVSVAVADPGYGAFFTPGSGIRDGKKIQIQDPGSAPMAGTMLFLYVQRCTMNDHITFLKFFRELRNSFRVKNTKIL